MDRASDRGSNPLFICTIEPEYSQLIGACMQFLALQAFQPKPAYLLRVLDGEKTEHAPLLSMAGVAGISTTSIRRHSRNRFANKWVDLDHNLRGDGEVIVADWDVLNTGASALPAAPRGKVLARPNPADLYVRFAARAREVSPDSWDKSKLHSSINSGLVIAPRPLILQLAKRILELEERLHEALPDATDWQLEKLAASLAVGEIGWAALSPEWNVTAFSDNPDDRVFFWHYNCGHETTRELKQALTQPDEVERLLGKLSSRWPRQVQRFNGWYDCAVQRLGLNRLLPPSGRAVPSNSTRTTVTDPLPCVRNLLATCSSGLCNRLLLLAGALRLAHLTNRNLLLYWPNNSEAACEFNDLFLNQFRMFGERDIHYLLNSTVTIQLYNAWRIRGPHYPDIATDGDPQAEIVLIKGWFYPKLSHEVYDGSFYLSAREYLVELRPREALLERMNLFNLPEFSIGVHLRRAEVCPEFQISRDEHFRTIMRALLKEFPALKFFLATDDPLTAAKFCDEFGDRILQIEKIGGGRKRLDGMEEALIDLYLLSRTRAVLGNNFSTFTHTAAALGGIPVVIAKEETAGLGLPSTLEIYRAALTA
jgi:hypothetical protein